MNKKNIILSLISLSVLFACEENNSSKNTSEKPLSEEYYSGGQLGTVFDESPYAYELPTLAVENSGMSTNFQLGEILFEKTFNSNASGVRTGLGPAYVRNSCLTCHPGYGHGKRMDRYRANDYGNGYLLVVTDANDNYVSSLTGMPQTQAVSPYLPPINEDGIRIEWKNYTDTYNNTFPDGEKYSLIYPEVTIERSAFNVPMPDFYKVRLEATIGIYGTGLIDAIPDDSLLAQYAYEKSLGFTLNDAKYDPANFIKEADGTSHPGRYTYGLTRGTLQNGPGANAIWNITNVNRSDRTYNYITDAYAKEMSKNKSIQQELEKTEEEIYANLMSRNLPAEMSNEDYIDFMVWHRGLAVPAARDLDDPTVQRGKKMFHEAGCAACHRPSWTTGADDYSGDPMVKGKLPRYPYQKIWPYTDLLQHKLEMVNDIRTGWCRTMPLWGRGLSEKCTGASEHLHDMRARNYTEAIMWHGGDAKKSRDKFYNLSKEDRDALVKFLESI
ncbi:thiol oxidoreductase [Bacteroidia bacterium]|nr:thiol oxidoreductase [Bacteroidia bacterium]GHT29100.1 thiol oxidoreductase [Bacteroidia bacterium]GHT84849.1 thiol oxidoreductase [Bacteroidia bacterium]GHU82286.1 thiol oxidoreductase [Bacteroidia bacterium]